MARHAPYTVDTLWQLQRLGTPSLSPDGSRAVAAVARPDMAHDRLVSSLWVFPTQGPAGAGRALTHCGHGDSRPSWSPRGDRIAFIARREQQGQHDEEPQLYLIDPDGGEAHRAAQVPTGVVAFRWFPDGRRIALVSWVWPALRGGKAQARQMQAARAQGQSALVTEESLYRWWDRNLPMGRVPHLLVLDLASGRLRDLFEGSAHELPRFDLNENAFDVSPDGRHIVFVHDPAPHKHHGHPLALARIEVASGAVQEIAQHPDWHLDAPRHSPDGHRIAFIASHRGLKYTMPPQLAVWQAHDGRWAVESAQWDHAVQAPLQWDEDGLSVLLTAQDRGSQPLWRFDLADRRAERLVARRVEETGETGDAAWGGGWVAGWDKKAGTLAVALEGADHPPQLWTRLPGQPPRRVERLNDELLRRHRLASTEVVTFDGALGDAVTMRLFYPPGLDPAASDPARHPVLHLLHGGPHSVYGDNWHWRWNAHVFAAAGHVVACVNYHGSSGWGYAFLDSITHRWGELEVQDIEAASDWLLAQPWADPRRLHAAGGSYGGCLAAWLNGAAEPGRYAALVCHAGCWDWQAMYADDAYETHARELGADYWDRAELIALQSPASLAARMETPTLVSHGARDYRVPDAQGLAHYNTLKARGVPARLLWFPDEHHWIDGPRNSRLWYREVLDWLARHPAASPRG
ncbi:S9 family peptidase [Leptothrix discophora]|uniref:S9 family peptidase n=1 Tax=Leptothrix discophora TaxID=89 RepID=A0ABT9G6E8_LEPDI|nr:S9 family peptidase [Leptothrix discophora]MDP4302068.1 S9 family peptidase [Leptothrix discophora]